MLPPIAVKINKIPLYFIDKNDIIDMIMVIQLIINLKIFFYERIQRLS